ncbi:MAG: hypothetical protein PV353_08455, partial [Bartonella sp.]|nr:hypothetical protein [Bartonella sp.]
MKNVPVPIPTPNKIASSVENAEQKPLFAEAAKPKIETISHQSVQPKEPTEAVIETKAPIISLIQEKSGGKSERISGINTEEIERFCSKRGRQTSYKSQQIQHAQKPQLTQHR